MDQPNAADIRTNIDIGNGETADVHVRHAAGTLAFVAIYVRPNGPVPGYWFTSLDSKEAERAYWLAGAVPGCAERQAVQA